MTPDRPGWWWQQAKDGPRAVRVGTVGPESDPVLVWGAFDRTVTPDDRWLAPVATPEEVAALTAERDLWERRARALGWTDAMLAADEVKP